MKWRKDYANQAKTPSAKRKARRSNSAEYQRGYRAAIASTHAALDDDPVTKFAALLPYSALKAAYRAALQELHPDHPGGDSERTRELIEAWEKVERLHSSADEVSPVHASVQ